MELTNEAPDYVISPLSANLIHLWNQNIFLRSSFICLQFTFMPYSKKLWCPKFIGLASRPLSPEGRESVLVYNRKSKRWSSPTINDLPSVDSFLEGITPAYWICSSYSYYCVLLCLRSYNCENLINWMHIEVMTFNPFTSSSSKLLVRFWYNFEFCKAVNNRNMVVWAVMPCSLVCEY